MWSAGNDGEVTFLNCAHSGKLKIKVETRLEECFHVVRHGSSIATPYTYATCMVNAPQIQANFIGRLEIDQTVGELPASFSLSGVLAILLAST